MTYGDDRYREIDRMGCGITEEEASEGWHFCDEWDEMLIGPMMIAEWECCSCFTPETKLQYELTQ